MNQSTGKQRLNPKDIILRPTNYQYQSKLRDDSPLYKAIIKAEETSLQ